MESSADSNAIGARLRQVRTRIAAAAERAGRSPGSVTLVTVAKTFGPRSVRSAVVAGARDIGENYVREALSKMEACDDLDPQPRWHFIGHLQRNKAGRAARRFDLVHTLDGVPLAEQLDRAGAACGRMIHVLIEVNVSGEDTKNGIRPHATAALLSAVAPLRHVAVDGLMTIPPLAPQPEMSRPHFRRLASLRAELTERGFDLPHLSMGMTSDFEIAIEEGATIVRVGRAIFGTRADHAPR